MRKMSLLLAVVMVLSALFPCMGVQAAALTTPESSYIVLDDDTKADWSLQQDLYVDLNGNYLTGTIVTNGYKIFGMDSFTDSYNAGDAGEFRCVDENGLAVTPEPYAKYELLGQMKRYMTIENDGKYSFHRMYLGITHTSLSPADTGVGFKATFRGTDAVQEQVASIGYRLWIFENHVITRSTDAFQENLSLRVKNFDPELYGETPVYATVFMTLRDGAVFESACSSVTLRSAVESVSRDYTEYTAAQLDAVWAMVECNPVMQTWEVDNLQIGKLSENKVYHLRMAQNNLGKTFYMAGGLSGEYWATTTDEASAADIYVQKAGEGYQFYYLNNTGSKTYIQAYMKSSNSSRPQASTVPTQTWYYNNTLGVYTVTMNGAEYYMGTYNSFNTIGVSNVKYISGSSAANVGISQFVAEFVVAGAAEPEQPDDNTGGDGGSIDPEACPGHTDANDNGYCDLCNTYVIVVIDLYAINDLHGKLTDGDNHPGVDELSTYMENIRNSRDNVILLSSGDMWQGAAESNLTKGLIITDWMNEMDFVSMTIGNHEFDWGQEYIRQNADFAEFPFLAINIYDRTTNSQVDYCQSSVVVEADGIQIGIIGAVGDCYSSISADRSSGVTFKTGTQLVNLVKEEADRLRAEGVDFIVLSIHDGGENSSDLSHYNTALSNGYVDLVFEGHTHQSYVQKDSYGVYHLQGGGDNKGISYAELSYNTVNDTYSVSTAQNIKTSVYTSLPDHPLIQRLMVKYDALVSKANEVLGNNRTKRTSEQICQMIANLYTDAGVEKWGDTYDIVLGGGFLNTRSPYDLSAGQVTYGKLMSLLPFDNRLVLCTIKGSDLKKKFINSTNSDYYIGYSAYGNSVKNNIVDFMLYYVVVDTYTAYYSSNNLTIVQWYDDDVYARDFFAQYIREGNLK